MSKKLTTSEFIARCIASHGDRYDYSKTVYTKSCNKVLITCKIHGDFEQYPSDHMNGRGCQQCARELTLQKTRGTQEDFIERAKALHGDLYDYSKVKYVNSTTKVDIVCPEHGVFQQDPAMHLAGTKCPKCSRISAAEKLRYNAEDVITKAKAVHNNKYTYIESTLCSLQIEAICSIHGKFTQLRDQHLRGHGCPKCFADSLRIPIEEWKRRAMEKHGNKYDYSRVTFKNVEDKVDIICPTHGVFSQKAHSHYYYGSGCPSCAKTSSSYEETIRGFLDEAGVTYQSRVMIRDISICNERWEVDIYIPEKRVGIEVNGVYWHSELQGKDRRYHLDKTQKAQEAGIKLIHVFTDVMDQHPEIVKTRLMSLLGKSPSRVFARQCFITPIKKDIEREFLTANHLQGYTPSAVCFGLMHGANLVALMSFGKQRKALGGKKGSNAWELLRFACVGDTTVVGGASRLLKQFIKHQSPEKIITYADRCWSDGEFYKKIGFTLTHASHPSYWYLSPTNTVHHRYKFAKHTLEKQLAVFDPEKTEWENMQLNGYNRYWDCGNFVFEMIP